MPAPANLVHQTTSGTGTGNLSLSSVNGKRTFASAFGTGASQNVFDYFISSRDAAEWERGTGHMSDSTTLVRDAVLESSNSNALVNFSAGTKDVANDIPASQQDITGLTEDTSPDPVADFVAIYDVSASSRKKAKIASFTRERLTANRTYYVRANLGTCTISIASPAVVTKTAHGLQANDPVVLSILPNTKSFTITEANPGVVTCTAHGFSAGQPVKLQSTVRLPKGLTQNTTYYVKAVTANTFELEPTIGGGSINTTAPTFTITIASPGVVTLTAHGFSAGDPVVFATSGALPTGLTAGTTYFVKTVVDANSFQISATPEGSAINTSGTQSGTHTLVQGGLHRLEMVGALPTGLTEGTVYYVKTVQDADHFTVSATVGGAEINTSGTQSGIISVATGNDNNDGLAATRAGALLTKQTCWNKIAALDLSNYTATMQLADSVYTTTWFTLLNSPIGTSKVIIKGNTTLPSNVRVAPASDAFSVSGPAQVWIKDLKIACTGLGILAQHPGCVVDFTNLEFGACNEHIRVTSGQVSLTGGTSYAIAGGGGRHVLCSGKYFTASSTPVIWGRPNFTDAFVNIINGYMSLWSCQWTGLATGTRWYVSANGVINTFGQSTAWMPGSAAGAESSGGKYI